jgi:short-subunit dehydrogenase
VTGTPPAGRGAALVTGASSGIGLALAQRFAAAGHDLVLVARDAQALGRLRNELIALHDIRVHVHALDLTTRTAARTLYDALEAAGVVVDILVNNAGFGVHGAFGDTDLSEEHRMVELQIQSFLELTKLFLAPMRRRRAGRVLNVASVYSFAPVPYQAVYAGCKAFMYIFSAALRDELRGEGITVTVVTPGSTRTAFRKRAGVHETNPEGKGMSAALVAAAAYSGTMRGAALVVPGGLNKLFALVAGLLPRGLLAPLMRRINGVRGLAGHPPSR